MMHPTFHITIEMMKSVLEPVFTGAVTQPNKDAAKHLRNMLVETHSAYQSVVFDIMEMAARHDRRGLAKVAFLVGMQAGYELGIAHPPPAEM